MIFNRIIFLLSKEQNYLEQSNPFIYKNLLNFDLFLLWFILVDKSSPLRLFVAFKRYDLVLKIPNFLNNISHTHDTFHIRDIRDIRHLMEFIHQKTYRP